jgi:hypothetical protein
MAESEETSAAIASLLDEGVAPDDPRAMDAVERHRVLIDRWFYPCSHEMHAELGRMYVADPRFTATYERIRPGMARYVSSAIAANAARAKSIAVVRAPDPARRRGPASCAGSESGDGLASPPSHL